MDNSVRPDDTTRSDQTRIAMRDGLGAEPVPAGRQASLVVLAGWEIGREIPLTQSETLLGRLATADVAIAEQSVSRQHARIHRVDTPDASCFELADLGSSNGTRVNNAPVSSCKLEDGDIIQLGEVVLKFVLRGELEARFYREMHRRIHYDQLTGLLTMNSFQSYLAMELGRATPDTPHTLAMTDLDGLKRVNDTHGHLAGRMVVREMGAIMRDAMRPNDVPGLYGGDEGIILFPATTIEQAEAVAEDLRQRIQAREFSFRDARFRVTISQGLAEWPTHALTPEELIAAADQALYAAKAAGRNCVRRAGGAV